MKKILLFSLILFISGCAETGVYLAEAHALDVEVIRTVSAAYCKLPQKARLINRNRLNDGIAPNTIMLTCVGDSTATVSDNVLAMK